MNFRTTFERMIAARERQAKRYVTSALLNMDDETLRRAGYDRKSLRANGNTFLYL
jgi:uncharacterized protein YjeT (DUF2065 family)